MTDQEIIDAAVEKALLMLPEVVGSLMAQQAAFSKINTQFYKEHPEFMAHKAIVVACVEKIDGAEPLLEYNEKLKKAIPIIRERIAMLSRLDMVKADRPNRDFNNGEI